MSYVPIYNKLQELETRVSTLENAPVPAPVAPVATAPAVPVLVSLSPDTAPVDVSSFATKADLPDVSGFATKAELPDVSGFAAYATKAELPDVSGFATKAELPDLSAYATKAELPDVSGFAAYATKAELPDLSAYATKAELPDVSSFATKAELPDVSGLATKADIVRIVKQTYPDIRKTLNLLQSSLKNGELQQSREITNFNQTSDQIITLLKGQNIKNFTTIRQLVMDSNVRDYNELYRVLFERADEFTNSAIATLIIADYQYKSIMVPDKEITFCGCIAKLLTTK